MIAIVTIAVAIICFIIVTVPIEFISNLGILFVAIGGTNHGYLSLLMPIGLAIMLGSLFVMICLQE